MILVTGASGLIGGETARQLGELGHDLRLLARRVASVEATAPARAELVVGDFDAPATLAAALDGVEAVLLVSPSNPDMVRQQGNVVDAVHDANAAGGPGRPIRVVKVSGFMTSLNSASSSGRWHARIEASIAQAGLPATVLRPPFFMQNLLRLGAQARSTGIIEAPIADARIAMVDARDIAAVAVGCLVDARHVGQRYLVTGPAALGYSDVARELSEVIGREVRYRPITMDESQRQLEAAGTPDWRSRVVMEFQQGFLGGLGAAISPTVEQVTGVKARSLAAFMRDARAALRVT